MCLLIAVREFGVCYALFVGWCILFVACCCLLFVVCVACSLMCVA